MWKHKQPNICRIYLRLGSHKIITTKRIIWFQNRAQEEKTINHHTKCGCNKFSIWKCTRREKPSLLSNNWIDLGVYLDKFSLNSCNFLDLLVELFWVLLISYFGSIEILVDSAKAEGLVKLGWNIVVLDSKF